MKSILDKKVSCFKNYNSPNSPKEVNLLVWLNSLKFKGQVQLVRELTDKNEKKKVKSNLPCITPSGLFSYRSERNLIQHSGLIQIDIDPSANNLNISNWDELKKEISKITNIAYLGDSVSGNGYWGLIPIAEPKYHKQFFDVIYEKFDSFGIELDKLPKNIASLRGYSVDENAFFNHQAKPLTNYKKVYPVNRLVTNTVKPSQSNQGIVEWVANKMNSAIEGQRHEARLRMGKYLGGLIAGGQVSQNSSDYLVNSYLSNYGSFDDEFTQQKEIKAINDGIEEGLKSPIYQLQNDSSLVKQEAKKTKVSSSTKFIPMSEYISTLHFENGLLMTKGYPAEWDIHAPYISVKCRELIQQIVKTPMLLKLIKTAELAF
jgi:hypothetical protein